MAIGVSEISGFGRLPDASMQMDGVGRLPDTSVQVDGFGRLPDASRQMDGIEHVAGGLGRLGALGAAAPMPGAPTSAMPWFNKPGYKPPGTDVQKGIAQAAKQAEEAQKKANALKAKALLDLKKNERTAAGMTAVQALQTQRKADELRFSAAKTAAVLSNEARAAVLEKEAGALQAQVDKQAALTGESGQTVAMRAKIKQLRDQAAKLRAEAAVTAAKKPPQQIPSNERIAEVAAKFGVRTRRNAAISRQDDMLLLATLQNVNEEMSFDSAFGGVGYMGALAEYGNDQIGQMMAAAEMGDTRRFVTALQGLGAYATEPSVPGYPRKGCVPGTLPGTLTGSPSEWDAAFKAYADCAYPKADGPAQYRGEVPSDPAKAAIVAKWNARALTQTRASPPWTQLGRFAAGLPSPDFDDIKAAVTDTVAGAAAAKEKLGSKPPAPPAPKPPAPAAGGAPTPKPPAPGAGSPPAPKPPAPKPPAPGAGAPPAPGADGASTPPAPSTGLSTAAKVGIGVGVVAVGLGAIMYMRRRPAAPVQGW